MKLFPIFLICLILSSCNSPRAVYDYDEQVNFTGYRTVGIYPELVSGLNELFQKRLITALEEVLQEENLELNTNPDLYVNVYSEEFSEPSRNRLGIGIGSGGGNAGVGVSGGIPLGGRENYLKLTFDLVDAYTDELVWQAVVESPFDLNADPERKARRLRRMVSEAFEGYPPKKRR